MHPDRVSYILCSYTRSPQLFLWGSTVYVIHKMHIIYSHASKPHSIWRRSSFESRRWRIKGAMQSWWLHHRGLLDRLRQNVRRKIQHLIMIITGCTCKNMYGKASGKSISTSYTQREDFKVWTSFTNMHVGQLSRALFCGYLTPHIYQAFSFKSNEGIVTDSWVFACLKCSNLHVCVLFVHTWCICS